VKGIFRFLARFRRSKRRYEAACYSYDQSLFICAVNEIRDGPGIQWEPFHRLSSSESDDAVGKFLTRILDDSGRVLAAKTTTDVRNARKEQLRAAGFSSERDLQKRAFLCIATRLPDSVRILPTHNGGIRGDTKGFQFLEEAVTTIKLPATDSELGAALRAALRNCTGQIGTPGSSRTIP